MGVGQGLRRSGYHATGGNKWLLGSMGGGDVPKTKGKFHHTQIFFRSKPSVPHFALSLEAYKSTKWKGRSNVRNV